MGFKGEALNISYSLKGRTLSAPFLLMLFIKEEIKRWTKSTAQRAKNVKGVALKTHEGLRPSTLQAFEKA